MLQKTIFNKIVLILFVISFLLFELASADTASTANCYPEPCGGEKEKNSEFGISTTTQSNTQPSSQQNTPPPPPPNPITINGVEIKDYSSDFSTSGTRISFSSATYARSSSLDFNNLGNAVLNAKDGNLISAKVTSTKDNNIFTINNPLEIGSKIKIHLNNSQSFEYAYDDANKKIEMGISEKSFINITKGANSIRIDSNSAQSKIIIEEGHLAKNNLVYEKPKYTITNANLSYQNQYGIEKLSTQSTSSVLIDAEKGFGYLLLNGKIGIMPGDVYEYLDLVKKEKSYALYNNGENVYEYGFFKAGFVFDMLSLIGSKNYGYEGDNQIMLFGVIEYKRLQSFEQAKQIAGNYQNYNKLDLPFLSVYSSDLLQNSYQLKNTLNFAAENSIAAAENKVINTQNVGHYRIALETKSPAAYYIYRNLQDCPDYLKTTQVLNDASLAGQIIYVNGTLKYKNLKIYSENTKDWKKLDDKLKQMIVANNPEKFSIVRID